MAEKSVAGIGYEIPVNEDNEASILCTFINDEGMRKSILTRCKEDHFRRSEFYTVAWTVFKLYRERVSITLDTIAVESLKCHRRHNIDHSFLKKISENYPILDESGLNTHISRLIEDYAKSEALKLAFGNLINVCMDPGKNVSDLRSSVERMLDRINETNSAATLEFKTMEVLVPEYLEEKSKEKSFRTTGISQVDAELTEGFKEKTIVTICGLSGSGKSSALLTMLKNLANKNIYSAMFSLEMHNMAVTTKLLAYQSNLPINLITKDFSRMSAEEKEIHDFELQKLSKNKYLHFIDKPSSLQSIKEQIMILQDSLQTNYIPVAIDLFGKIKDFRGSENFARDYETKLNIVQEMVKSLDTCIILVAQINRDVMKRKFNRPTMADLKNANAFAEVSDLILGIHRPYYDPEKALKRDMERRATLASFGDDEEARAKYDISFQDDPNVNLAEILVLKQRMGEGNRVINMFFNPFTTCYQPLTAEYEKQLAQNKLEDDGF